MILTHTLCHQHFPSRSLFNPHSRALVPFSFLSHSNVRTLARQTILDLWPWNSTARQRVCYSTHSYICLFSFIFQALIAIATKKINRSHKGIPIFALPVFSEFLTDCLAREQNNIKIEQSQGNDLFLLNGLFEVIPG